MVNPPRSAHSNTFDYQAAHKSFNTVDGKVIA